MKSNIKTICGLEKYKILSKKKGFFNKLRFYWFVLFASIRDFGKKILSRINNQEKITIFQLNLNYLLLLFMLAKIEIIL